MKFSQSLESFRYLTGPHGSAPYSDYGAFEVPGPCGNNLHIIASPGDAHEDIHWEHVSVSVKNRCPNWVEMCFVKGLFWDDEDAVATSPTKVEVD